MSNRRILPIPMGVLPESYAVAIDMSMDENYVLSAQLVDQKGNAMGTAQTVDLPMESVIVNGRYDDNTQSLILVLDNGNEITIPISGLIAGLQEEITAQNPLSADLVADGTTNKVFTATEQTKLSGIEAGAEVNVQANWNESDSSSDSYIQNKPTLGTMAAENASDYTPTSSLSSVATSGSYTDLSNTPDLSIYAQSSNLASVATSGSYTDLSNTPTIPTVNDATITLQDGNGTSLGSFTTNDANNQMITIPAGGGGNEWFGSQAQFDALGTYDNDTTYYIQDHLTWNEIDDKPLIATRVSQLPNDSNYQNKVQVNQLIKNAINTYDAKNKWVTQAEYNTLVTNDALEADARYHIEGPQTTVQMVVTFTDQSTATYDVYIGN